MDGLILAVFRAAGAKMGFDTTSALCLGSFGGPGLYPAYDHRYSPAPTRAAVEMNGCSHSMASRRHGPCPPCMCVNYLGT